MWNDMIYVKAVCKAMYKMLHMNNYYNYDQY
jgi:hypothetical protein